MEGKATKQISVTIPYDMWMACKKEGINVSATVKEALLNKLNQGY
jgi:post-segregation antitoxin (ccd killing protein)